LVRLTEITGEHFRLGIGREIEWMRNDTPDSGLYAEGNGHAVHAHDNPDLLLLSSLTEVADSYERVTRVYPYGAEVDGERVTLANATDSAPAGYTLSTADNYLELTGATPSIHRREQFSDVARTSTGDSTAAQRSNALLAATHAFLVPRATAQKTYSASFTGTPRLLDVGETIPARYVRIIDGVTAIDVNSTFIVTERTNAISGDGAFTVNATLSTTTRPTRGATDTLIKIVREQQA